MSELKTGSPGLSSQEARKRLAQYGANEIGLKKKIRWFKLLFSQFTSPLIYILFFAGLITLFLKEWTDSIVIFMAVFVNTILGFAQEFKAEKALVALKGMLILHVKVIRDGKEDIIEATKLVPGDVVILSTGDKVPADGILLSEVDLHVNEAILTGESVPIKKLVKEEAFMGTVIVSGRGKMKVKHTGLLTKMGKIADKLEETNDEETPLKKQIGNFSKVLAVIFSLVCVIIFFEGLWRGREFIEVLTLSVAVAVAAIPEGLAVSLTVILTLGMQRILARKSLVRKLLAAETLGSVDVICTDKTGTLTEGKMRVVGAEFTNKETGIKGAILCNNMINPLEIAMMDWAKTKLKPDGENLLLENPRLDEIPFSSEKKFIATLNRQKSSKKADIFLSGAPEMVMEMSNLSKEDKKKWLDKLDHFTKKGLRVIAFSYMEGSLEKTKRTFSRLRRFGRYDGKNKANWESISLKWLGLLLFEDPIRTEVKESLQLCKKAGIEVKVITGDYLNTARAILDKLEINDGNIKDEQIMEGWELEKISEEELVHKIDDLVLFVRATPEQKIRIVEALQAKGHSVAMMGDGVNDALALKRSDIGVVVGEASEVAKETADMVLLDSNFKTIVAAVEEGRGIFENIKKVVLYLLSDSFTEVVLIGGSLLLGLPSPLLPAQILWVNLVEDGLPGLALAFEPKDDDLMNEPPRPKHSSILDKEMKIIIFIIGLTADFFLLAIFLFLLDIKLSLETIRTIIFAGLAMDSLLYIFSCKTLRKNIWHENIFSNSFLVFSVGVGFLMLFVGIYLPFFNVILKTVPLEPIFWVLVIFKALLTVLGIEAVKWLFLRNHSLKQAKNK